MQTVSVRSYLTAGLAMTTAGAIAFAPALTAPPTSQQVALPSISHSQVQLSAVIDPADIAAFLAQIEDARVFVNDTVADLLNQSGQTVADVLATAIDLNDQLWATLAAVASSSALQILINGLEEATSIGLTTIQNAVGAAAAGVVMSVEQVTTLLTATLAGALSAATTAIAGIINDPLSFDSYVAALSLAAMQLDFLPEAAFTAGNVVDTLGASLFGPGGVAVSLNDGIAAQAANIISTVNALIAEISAAIGSEIVTTILQAVQLVTVLPLVYLTPYGVGALNILADTGLELTGALAGSVNSLGDALWGAVWPIQYAIDTIGAAPLDPSSYTQTLAAAIVGVGAVFNGFTGAAGEIAKMPFIAINGITNASAMAIQGVVLAISVPAATLLTELGLTDAATAINEFAANINDFVDQVATGITDFSTMLSDGIQQGVTDLQDANTAAANDLAQVVVDLTGDSVPVLPAPPAPPMVMSLSVPVSPAPPSLTATVALAPTDDDDSDGAVALAAVDEGADAGKAADTKAETAAEDDATADAKAARAEARAARAEAKAAAKAARAEAKAASQEARAAKAKADADTTETDTTSTEGGGAGDAEPSGTTGGAGDE